MTPQRLTGNEPRSTWTDCCSLYQAFGQQAASSAKISADALRQAVLADDPGFRLAIMPQAGLIAWREDPDAKFTEILDLYIAHQFRRQGFARYAIDWLVQCYPAAEAICVDVDQDNASAIALYTCLGFQTLPLRLMYLGGAAPNASQYYDVENDAWYPAAPPNSIKTITQLNAARNSQLDRVWLDQGGEAYAMARQIYDFHPSARRMEKGLPHGG